MADHRPEVGVRFCGGCNPRYDRVAELARLAARFPHLRFVPATGVQPLVLLVCGCSAQCVEREDLDGECLVLFQPCQFASAARRLQTL